MGYLKVNQNVRWIEDGQIGTVKWVGGSFAVVWCDGNENWVYFNYSVFENGLMEAIP